MSDIQQSLQEQISVGQKENEELRRRNEELQRELDKALQDLESMQWQNARQVQDLQDKNGRLSESKDKMWSELSSVKQQMQLLCDMLECSSVMGLYSAVQQCQTRMFDTQEEADYLRKELQSKTLAAEAQQTQITELQAQLLRERQEYEYKLEKEKRKFCNEKDKWGEKEYALIEAIQNQSRKLVKGSSAKLTHHHSSDASNSTDDSSSQFERPSKFANQRQSYAPSPCPPISPLPIAPVPQLHPSPSYNSYHLPNSPSSMHQQSRPQTPQNGNYRPLFGQFAQTMPTYRGFGIQGGNTQGGCPPQDAGQVESVLQNCQVQSALENRTLETKGSSNDPALSRAAARVRKMQHCASVFYARN